MRKLIIAAPEYFVSVEAKLAPSIELSIYFLQKLKKEYDFILVLRTVDNISDSALQQLTETLNKRKIDYFLTDNDVHNCADLKALADEHGIAESELSKSIIFLDSDNSNEVKNIINTTLPETGEDWEKLIEKISAHKRTANVVRETNETKIEITLLLDGSGKSNISTGLDFFDHMLDQLARHGQVDLQISAKGDLHIDEHHTIEDTGLALGQAFREALGNKIGIERYGFLLPMDDCLAQVAIDFGGRPWLVWAADFKREKIGEMPTEMFFHFFKSFSDAAQCNLNIKAEGQNEHHKIESIFKAFAKAIKMAVGKTGQKNLPSTKGVL